MALDKRNGSPAVFEDDGDGLIVQDVRFIVTASVFAESGIRIVFQCAPFKDAFDIIGFAMFFQEGDDAMDFVIRDESAMHAVRQP